MTNDCPGVKCFRTLKKGGGQEIVSYLKRKNDKIWPKNKICFQFFRADWDPLAHCQKAELRT